MNLKITFEETENKHYKLDSSKSTIVELNNFNDEYGRTTYGKIHYFLDNECFMEWKYIGNYIMEMRDKYEKQEEEITKNKLIEFQEFLQDIYDFHNKFTFNTKRHIKFEFI